MRFRTLTALVLVTIAVFVYVSLPEGFGAQAGAAAKPAPARTPGAAGAAGAVAADTETKVTIDELKQLLQQRQAPRVRVKTGFGGTATGKAVGITGDKLELDVSAESTGVSGVLGVALSNITSITVLVPMTQEEIQAAKKASEDYLGAIGAQEARAEELASTGSEMGAGALASSESLVEAAASAESNLAEEGQEEKVDLLAKYPPSEGWGPKKLAETVRKAVVLHLQPFGKEQTFLKDYDAWKLAYENKRSAQLEAVEALKGMNKPVPADMEVLPELEPVPSLEGAAPTGGPSAP